MPGTPTTKYALPTMAGSDIINTIDDWTVSFGAAVDSKLAPSDQGAFSARPVSTVGSPGKSGRTYFATDTGKLYRDNGTGWDEVALAAQQVATDGVWRPYMSDVAVFGSAFSGSTYFVANGGLGISGSGGTAIPRMLAPTTISDYAVASRTTKLRVQATILANSAPAGTTITFGLYPVTAITGTSANVIYTLGTVVSGSTIAATIVAGGGDRRASTAFDLSALSAVSTYVLGFTVPGTTTGVHSYVELQMRHV